MKVVGEGVVVREVFLFLAAGGEMAAAPCGEVWVSREGDGVESLVESMMRIQG